MALSSVVLFLLTFAPGSALAWAATAPRSRARYALLGASPALTLGVAGGALGWSGALGLGWSAITILVLEVALAGLAVIARMVRRGPDAGRRCSTADPHPSVRRGRDLGALAGAEAIVLGIGVWLLGRLSVPPGWDAMNHGFMARMLLDHGAVPTSQICVTGSTRGAASCTFYPLAPHVLWAQTAELTGQPLSHALLATAMLLGPAVAVLSVFVVARCLGAATCVAFASASACGLVGPLWQMLDSGRVTAQLGAALSPGVALIAFMAFRHRRARALTVLAGVALTGLLVVHTYDAVFAGIFGLGLLLAGPVGWRPVRRSAMTSAGVLLVTVLAVGPQWAGLLGADGQRSVLKPSFPGDLSGALRLWLSPLRYLGLQIGRHDAIEAVWLGSASPWVAGGIIIAGWLLGLVLSLHHDWRWLRPFALTWAFTFVLVVYLSVSSSPLRHAMGSLFYGNPERVFWAGTLSLAVLGVAGWAAVLTLTWEVLQRRLRGRPPRHDRARSVASALALMLIATVVISQPVNSRSSTVFASLTPNSPAYGRVAHWLTGHLRPGAVVADDVHRDFVTWLAVDQGVPVLDGIEPITVPGERDWQQRQKVWRALTGTIRSPAPCLLDPYDVQFVVVSTEHMPGGVRTYEPSRLDRSRYLRLVHQDGPLRVYATNHGCQEFR